MSDRSLAASIAAHEKWAHEDNRTQATAPARKAFMERFENEVDPDRKLPPAERAKRAENARSAYFSRLALKSRKARQVKRDVETELEALLDELRDDKAEG